MRKMHKNQVMMAKIFSIAEDGEWERRGECPRKKLKNSYYYDEQGDCRKRINKELTRILGYNSTIGLFWYKPLTEDLYVVITKVVANTNKSKALSELGFKIYEYNEAFA